MVPILPAASAAASGALATLGLLIAAAAVVLSLLALTIRLDPAGLLRRHRLEQAVRRGTAELLAEAERARGGHSA